MQNRVRNTRAVSGTLCKGVLAVLVIAFAVSPALGQETAAKKRQKPAEKSVVKTRAASRTAAMRTLDAINIEGEIAVPQVLFITAREFRRFRDGLDLKYRMDALDVARSLTVPTRIRVIAKKKEEGQ